MNKEKYNSLREGDIIHIINNTDDERITKVINKLIRYKNFKEYLIKEGLDKTLPGINNIEKGENIYYSFFSKEDEEKYGVLAIHMS